MNRSRAAALGIALAVLGTTLISCFGEPEHAGTTSDGGAPPVVTAPPPGTAWMATFGGSGDETARCVRQTSDNGYIVAGTTYPPGYSYLDVYLVKTDASGTAVWTKSFGGSRTEECGGVRQTSDRGYIVVGTTQSFGNGPCDVYLVKTDASGDVVWARTFGGSLADGGRAVQQTSDGGYIVAGWTDSGGSAGNDGVYLVKTDASGNALWTTTLGGTAGNSVQQTSDGGYIVAGYTYDYVNGSRGYLVKTDASGTAVWTRAFGGSNYFQANDVRQTSDGGYVVLGDTMAPGGPVICLLKTDASGNAVWTKTFGGGGADQGSSVWTTADGGCVVAGYTSPPPPTLSGDLFLLKTDASGNAVWTKAIGGTGDDRGFSVQQTSDGSYVVAGGTTSFGAGGWDVFLVKLNAD